MKLKKGKGEWHKINWYGVLGVKRDSTSDDVSEKLHNHFGIYDKEFKEKLHAARYLKDSDTRRIIDLEIDAQRKRYLLFVSALAVVSFLSLILYLNIITESSVTISIQESGGIPVSNNSIAVSDTLNFQVKKEQEPIIKDTITCLLDGRVIEGCENSTKKNIDAGNHVFTVKLNKAIANKNSQTHLNFCREKVPIDHDVTNLSNSSTVSITLKPVCTIPNATSGYAIEWGDGFHEKMVNFTANHVYKKNGNYSITIINDGNNGSGKKVNTTATVQVRNPAYELLTYKNYALGFKIDYPPSIEKVENTTDDDELINKIVHFNTHYQGFDDNYQEYYLIGIDKSSNQTTLNGYLNELILNLKDSYDGYNTIESSTNATLGGQPAYKLIYSYNNAKINATVKTLEMGTFVKGKVYYILFEAETKEFENYLPQATSLINSFQLFSPTETLSYKNTAYGITVDYPPSFRKVENTTDDDELINRIVEFYTPLQNTDDNYYQGSYSIGIDKSSNQTTLNGYLNELILNLKDSYDGYNTIESSTNATLGGQPAYKLIYSYNGTDPNTLRKVLELGTIVQGKVYYILFDADAKEFENNLPQATSFINSFQFGTLIYKNTAYSITVDYPANFEKSEKQYRYPDERVIDIVTFFQPSQHANDAFQEYYRISWGPIEYIVSLYQYLVNTIKGYQYSYDGYNTIESSTNATLGGQPAYKLIYSYNGTDPNTLRKVLEIGTIVNGKVYFVEFEADAKEFENNLPQATSFINSFRFD